jgi:hypothetical protein
MVVGSLPAASSARPERAGRRTERIALHPGTKEDTMKAKRKAGPPTFGRNLIPIDRAGFWPGLDDNELELMRTRLRSRLSPKQAKRADLEAERREARAKAPAPQPKRYRKSAGRFVGEGEYTVYGKRRDDLRGEFTVKGSKPTRRI